MTAAGVDTLTRVLFAAGTLYVIMRGLWFYRLNHITHMSRRWSLLTISVMLVPGAIFWIVIYLERSLINDALRWDAWLSRFAWFWVLVGSFVLQSFIRLAETNEE